MASFPLHTAAFYKPLPTEKGTTDDIMPFMPPLEAVIAQIALLASFNRPPWEDTTLTHLFGDSSMMHRMNDETYAAETSVRDSMEKFSKNVRSRSFDEYVSVRGCRLYGKRWIRRRRSSS